MQKRLDYYLYQILLTILIKSKWNPLLKNSKKIFKYNLIQITLENLNNIINNLIANRILHLNKIFKKIELVPYLLK